MSDANADVNRAKVRRVRRRTYGRDFKLQVVQRATRGMDSTELMQDFGISPIMVARWLREWQRDPAHAFRGYGRRKPFQEQVERLHRRLKKLRAERDLLKKALASFVVKPSTSSVSLQNIERSGLLGGCASFSMSRQVDTTLG